MLARAGNVVAGKQGDANHGGRFDARTASVLVWSTPFVFESSEPLSSFSIGWLTPTANQAPIWHVEWDPAYMAGLRPTSWRAIKTLAGRPLTLAGVLPSGRLNDPMGSSFALTG